MSTKVIRVTSAADGCGKPSSIRPMDNSHSSNMEHKESFMFSKSHFGLLASTAIAAGAALWCSQPMANAATLFYDTFTAANGTSLVGRYPSPTDVPGSAYQATNGSWESDIQNNQAVLGADIGVGVNLNNNSPTVYTISDVFNNSGDSGNHTGFALNGAALGFYNSFPAGGGEGFNEFTGLVVDNTGYVSLDVNGTDNGPFVSATGFNATGSNSFSYTVDTSTGTISNVLLNGNSVAITAPDGSFTPALTAYAGFFNHSTTGGNIATFDNFTVSTPEPATLGLFAVGGLGLLLLGRKRVARRNA